ncbi:MAG: hypothetical protein FWF82_07890 [Oscillospiraceae bacterium]|nr:hypothetical protein [Oscillospiraceae bacterium]
MNKFIKTTAVIAAISALLTSCGKNNGDNSRNSGDDFDPGVSTSDLGVTAAPSGNKPTGLHDKVTGEFDFVNGFGEFADGTALPLIFTDAVFVVSTPETSRTFENPENSVNHEAGETSEMRETLIFRKNGKYTHTDSGSSTIEGEYEVATDPDSEKDFLTLYFYDSPAVWRTFTVLNPAEIADSESETVYAVENPEKSETNQILFNERYFLNADIDSLSLYFWEYGDVAIEVPDKTADEEFAWEFDDENGTVIVFNGESEEVFDVANPYVITYADYTFAAVLAIPR